MTTNNPNTPLIAPRDGITYLPHQEEGIRWMLEREDEHARVCRGGVLADDMGLGKTFQTIGLIKNSPAPLTTLIVCPPALIAGWSDELEACGFFVRSLVNGSSVWNTVPAAMAELPTVYLCTYPKMQMYAAKLRDEKFQRVILDEGHCIRNGKSTKRWWAAMAVAKRSLSRWILSATPVQNGASDWTDLCWWLRVKCQATDIPQLASFLMLRRTMSDLRNVIKALPPSPRFISHDLSIPDDSAEGKLFRALNQQLESVMNKSGISGVVKLELYLRIQQFLVHPQLYIEGMRRKFQGAYPRPDWNGTAAKWDCFSALLDESVQKKIPTIVFCNFAAEMDMVEKKVADLGGKSWSVRGGMTPAAIGDSVASAKKAAMEGKEGVVIVVQIVSGGAGLNLQFCRRILFLSQHWNPAVVHQAVGRAVRIGQSAVVDIHLFRIVDGVMDNIDRIMVQKHIVKIAAAQELCASLYDSYEDVEAELEAFEEIESDAESEDSD